MQTVTRTTLYVFLAALTLGVSARDLSQDEALRLREQGRIMSLETVLALIAQRYPHSRLLEVELEQDDDNYIYEVELATRDGVVRELEFDAYTGIILKDEEDD